MKIQAKAAFAVTSWDEQTWDGQSASSVQGEKLTLARVSYTYSGDMAGQSQFEYLMTYRGDGSGVYVGLERFEGSVLGRPGAVVLQHSGLFDAQSVRGTALVVPGSGSGELGSLRGEGWIELAGQQAQYPITFEFELDGSPRIQSPKE
jgi:hypothetical protein